MCGKYRCGCIILFIAIDRPFFGLFGLNYFNGLNCFFYSEDLTSIVKLQSIPKSGKNILYRAKKSMLQSKKISEGNTVRIGIKVG